LDAAVFHYQKNTSKVLLTLLIYGASFIFPRPLEATISFGRSFDGTIAKDGNLIAALSF